MGHFLLLLWMCMSIRTSAQSILNKSVWLQAVLHETGLSTKEQFIAEPSEDTTIKDRDGNMYRLRIMPDNKVWMIDNLKINIPGSYCYGDMKQNCEQYGRLYTWESAGKVCSMLGAGWRLPTDDEWRQMAKQYGGVYVDSAHDGKAAYKALLSGGVAAFDVVLSGGRDLQGKYGRLDAHGFYWTATESDSTTAWFYNFGKGSAKLYRQNDGEKPRAFAVRCVRDVEILKEKR